MLFGAYKKILEGKHKEKPILPTTIQIGEYIIMNEVIGFDLFKFYENLEQKPKTNSKETLVSELLYKQLRDAAHIRTRKYDFSEKQIIKSAHEKKIIEVFEEADIRLRLEEKNKLSALIKPMNNEANYYFRDNASWNFKIEQSYAEYFLSEEFLYSEIEQEKIEKLVNKSIIAIDLDKLKRLTFQSDDALHTLEWPVPTLSQEDIREKEEYFVKKLSEHGENVRNYWNNRLIEGFYRHLRMNYFYKTHEQTYPDKDDKFKQHHLDSAYNNIYEYTFKKLPSKKIHNTTLDEILELVVHTNCRPSTI